jgi:hypothetical protein
MSFWPWSDEQAHIKALIIYDSREEILGITIKTDRISINGTENSRIPITASLLVP